MRGDEGTHWSKYNSWELSAAVWEGRRQTFQLKKGRREFALKELDDAHPYWGGQIFFIQSIDSNVNLF